MEDGYADLHEDYGGGGFQRAYGHQDPTRIVAQHLEHETMVREVRFSTHSARREIVHIAEEQNIDLIAVATHGRHVITPIPGSITYGVTYRAPYDVLAERARA